MDAMHVETRDSVSLKPAEVDDLNQLVLSVGLPIADEQLDAHIEQFPLVALAADIELQGFLLGSLERIGGTPCILWGLGAVRRGRTARPALDGLVAELYRRAASSFPDEDVLVAARVSHPGAYALFATLDDVCPRPKYAPDGEERAWGRRLARRFGCDDRYDDRSSRLAAHGRPEAILDARTVKAGGRPAAELLGGVDPARGEAVIAYGWATAESLADGPTNR
jgi:hypothetical protein